MNEQIKDIFNEIKNEACYTNDELILTFSEGNSLLNYITNLQKENQSLKNNYNDNEQAIHKIMEENEKLKDIIKKDNHLLGCNFSKKDKYKQERDIYKQINGKAIEYIEQHCDRPGKLLLPKIDFNYNDLLNILQGGDE